MSRSAGRLPRCVAALFALSAVWLVAYELHVVVASQFGVHDVFDRRVHLVVLLAASGLVLARAVTRRGERLGWLLIGAGMLAWSLGEVYYTLALWSLPSIPIPSAADGGYLAFPVLTFAGVGVLARSRVHAAAATLWADGLAAALAVGAVSAALVLEPVLRHASGRPLEVITNLAYPVTDIVLIGACVAVVGLRGWRLDRTWALIGGGALVFWVADSLYLVETALGTYTPGGVFDEGWWLGLTLIGLAAWQSPDPASASTSTSERGWMVALPVGFGALAAGVLGYGCLRSHPLNAGAVALALAALAAVGVRLVITFRLSLTLVRRVREDSLTDPLTGLANRRALFDASSLDEISPRDRAGHMVLALYDLDGFKRYNDTFGHPAGDALLARLSGALLRTVGQRGRCYRIGGDEFCVLVPGQRDAVQELLEAASRALSEQAAGFSVTSTWGAVSLPDESSALGEALHVADQRMYARKAGRGRWRARWRASRFERSGARKRARPIEPRAPADATTAAGQPTTLLLEELAFRRRPLPYSSAPVGPRHPQPPMDSDPSVASHPSIIDLPPDLHFAANLGTAPNDARLCIRPIPQAVACALVPARCGAPWHVTVVAA